jgi:hypothetical protein
MVTMIKHPDHPGGLLYATTDATPEADVAYAVDEQTGIEATLSEFEGVWKLEDGGA